MNSATKNPYEVLELEPACSMEEIKRRFRQQIALYHPDKVQHLGKEIQDLAARRAAELTEAYEILGNSARRTAFDVHPHPIPSKEPTADFPPKAQAGAQPQPVSPQECRSGPGEIEVSDFMRKTAMTRLRKAIVEHVPGADDKTLAGFDAAFFSRPKWFHFKSQPALCVLARLVGKVNAEAVKDSWRSVSRPGALLSGEAYLFLMGNMLEDPRILSRAMMEQRGKINGQNGSQVFMIPLNVSTWEVLTPCEAPPLLRSIIGTLRSG
jgi:curved DNA-binding protein CbpA